MLQHVGNKGDMRNLRHLHISRRNTRHLNRRDDLDPAKHIITTHHKHVSNDM
jgi:hypothetical protein